MFLFFSYQVSILLQDPSEMSGPGDPLHPPSSVRDPFAYAFQMCHTIFHIRHRLYHSLHNLYALLPNFMKIKFN